MKKFLLNLLLLGIIVAIPFGIINYYLGFLEHDYYRWSYDEVKAENENIEGIILGNSQATHGIRPSYLYTLDVDFFNFALNGSDSKFWLNWYDELYADTKAKPKVCIYSLTIGAWRKYEHDSQFFPVTTFWKNFFDFKNFEKTTLLKNRFPIFKYRNRRTIESKRNEKIYFDYEKDCH